MRLSACCLLMALCLQAAGQKLNVISVSELSFESNLSFINGEERLFTGTSRYSLLHQDEQLLVLFGDPAKYWLYKLDEDLLTILESNELVDGRKLGFNLGTSSTVDDTSKREPLDTSRAPIRAQNSDSSNTPIRQLWAQYKNSSLSPEEFEEKLDKYHKRQEKDGSLSLHVHTKPEEMPMHFGGSHRCYLLANYNEEITSGDFEIKVIYQLPEDKEPKTYSHEFSDKNASVSSVSEYQMDVNSMGHLVYLRHYYSEKGSYQSTHLVHCTPSGGILHDEQLGFVADKNSFLLEFEHDNTVKIIGTESNKQLVLCRATYNIKTHDIVRRRDPLSAAQIVGPSTSKTVKLKGSSANNILGYKACTDGTYIFLSKNAPATVAMPYFNSSDALKRMRLENKALSYLLEKNDPWRLRSISNAFYVVKLNHQGDIDWVNGLGFESLWVNDIGDGNDFPIVFNTQDKKWTKQLKGIHNTISQGIGMPMAAMVTSKGIRYVQPTFDLLADGCLILTKTTQLDNGEYVGFGAKVKSLEYDKLADGYYKINVTWHVVRFEVRQ